MGDRAGGDLRTVQRLVVDEGRTEGAEWPGRERRRDLKERRRGGGDGWGGAQVVGNGKQLPEDELLDSLVLGRGQRRRRRSARLNEDMDGFGKLAF
jgi:hypothetical protein